MAELLGFPEHFGTRDFSRGAARASNIAHAQELPAAVRAAERFVLPLIGWPIDLTEQGFRTWRSDMTELARCENVAVKIFGAECIFGLGWTVPQIRPWVLATIGLFGPARCMFASHMPIAALSRSIGDVYKAYEEIVEGFTSSERRCLFNDTAASNYRV